MGRDSQAQVKLLTFPVSPRPLSWTCCTESGTGTLEFPFYLLGGNYCTSTYSLSLWFKQKDMTFPRKISPLLPTKHKTSLLDFPHIAPGFLNSLETIWGQDFPPSRNIQLLPLLRGLNWLFNWSWTTATKPRPEDWRYPSHTGARPHRLQTRAQNPSFWAALLLFPPQEAE